MAQTTVELRNLLKTNFNLFDFDYSIDDPTFKKEVEEAIIDFYYFYEIGQETPDKFKHHFKARFKRIISYYNDLYNTTLLSYNPLTNYKMEEVLQQLATKNNTQGTTATTTTDTNSSFDNTTHSDEQRTTNNKASDYPQQSIGAGNYLNGEQLTEDEGTTTTATHGKNLGTDKTDSTGTIEAAETANTNYQKTIEGITRTTYQELIQLERENILRIKGQIIEEMKPCFMLTY